MYISNKNRSNSGKKSNIGMFETKPGYGGGNKYNKMVFKALLKEYDFKNFKISPQFFPKARRLRMLAKIMYLSRKESSIDLWIRNFLGVVGMKFVKKDIKNIGLLFHIDYKAISNKWLSQILDNYFWENLKKCDFVVVISKYWKQFFNSKGINNIKIIYPGLNISDFNFSQEEILKFKLKYSLNKKPIIYLGNCQESKGVREAYFYLKDIPYHLVTSGKKQIDIPALNLELKYRDYLLLLKSSSVVLTMSKFLEGWNITAHEAMLCKTPVIGSGKGGMKELLAGGNQIICKDHAKLPGFIEYALKNAESFGENGFSFSKNFTIERFEKEWVSLINHVFLNR